MARIMTFIFTKGHSLNAENINAKESQKIYNILLHYIINNNLDDKIIECKEKQKQQKL